jgi:hypothetical protein
MSVCKFKISIIIVLVFLFSVQVFSQQITYGDSLAEYKSSKVKFKPVLNYSVGSTFTFVPHLGNFTGYTFSPSLSIPLSSRWSVDGGIIAGRYYSASPDFYHEGVDHAAFNELSVYGLASYRVNSQLTVYGAGFKQLAGSSSFDFLPKTSYSVGSTYKFGNFSIGVNVQMSKWNDNLSPFPFNSSHGFYSPYPHGSARFNTFGF